MENDKAYRIYLRSVARLSLDLVGGPIEHLVAAAIGAIDARELKAPRGPEALTQAVDRVLGRSEGADDPAGGGSGPMSVGRHSR